MFQTRKWLLLLFNTNDRHSVRAAYFFLNSRTCILLKDETLNDLVAKVFSFFSSYHLGFTVTPGGCGR